MALGGPRSTAKSRQRASAGARAETLLLCFRRPARMFSGFDRATRGDGSLGQCMGRSKTADDSELHHEWTVPIGELKSINPGSSAQQNSPYILEAAVRAALLKLDPVGQDAQEATGSGSSTRAHARAYCSTETVSETAGRTPADRRHSDDGSRAAVEIPRRREGEERRREARCVGTCQCAIGPRRDN